MKPRDFLVYSIKPVEEGYHVRAGIPTLVGQLKEIDVSATGFVRYSMIRLLPRPSSELFVDDLGVPKPRHQRHRHKHGDHDVVTPADHILVSKRVPDGWFAVKFNAIRKGPFGFGIDTVTETLKEAGVVAMGKWFPFRPDTPTNSRHPWACAFENETDAVAFQAHIAADS